MLEIVDGKLFLAPKCKSRHLSTPQLWLKAWHIYKDTVLSFFPNRYQELLYYHCHIADLNQHFNWAAVLTYDAQFCHKCTMQGLPFSAFNQQLYVTMLQLPRCLPIDVSDANALTMRSSIVPFPGGSAGEGFGIEEGCSKPAGPGNPPETPAAVLLPPGLRPPTSTCLPPT